MIEKERKWRSDLENKYKEKYLEEYKKDLSIKERLENLEIMEHQFSSLQQINPEFAFFTKTGPISDEEIISFGFKDKKSKQFQILKRGIGFHHGKKLINTSYSNQVLFR